MKVDIRETTLSTSRWKIKDTEKTIAAMKKL